MRKKGLTPKRKEKKSGMGQGKRHRGRDLFERQAHLGFYGLDGDVEELCYLFIPEVAFFYQEKDEFAPGRQLVDYAVDVVNHLGRDHDLFGTYLPFGDKGLKVFFEEFQLDFFGAEKLQGAVPGAFQQIVFGMTYAPQGFPVLPDLYKDVVGDFFRGFPVTDDGTGQFVQTIEVYVVETGQRLFIRGGGQPLEKDIYRHHAHRLLNVRGIL